MTPSPALPTNPSPRFIEMQKLEQEQLAAYTPPAVTVQDRVISGSETNIPIKIFTPATPATGLRPIFVWFHGGAFVAGSYQMGESLYPGYELAARADAVVISVEYRLANDDLRFPAPQVDAFDAVVWARDNAAELGADAARLFVGGASAGACIAGSVSLMARDRKLGLAGVLPIYPVAHRVSPEHTEPKLAKMGAEEPLGDNFMVLHNPWLLEQITDYTPEIDSHHCFPGDSPEKGGQSPFLIINADNDALRTGGEKWASDLAQAGVQVKVSKEEGTNHGYLNFDPAKTPGAGHTLDLMAEFIRG